MLRWPFDFSGVGRWGQGAPAIIKHVLDHHGLVASQCPDLQLAQRIDKRLSRHPGRIVSYDTACVAMILNGLGFTNRRLYLTPQFFESKPVEVLLGPGIEARHLNDDALGDALDAIAQYGPSKLTPTSVFSPITKLSKQLRTAFVF